MRCRNFTLKEEERRKATRSSLLLGAMLCYAMLCGDNEGSTSHQSISRTRFLKGQVEVILKIQHRGGKDSINYSTEYYSISLYTTVTLTLTLTLTKRHNLSMHPKGALDQATLIHSNAVRSNRKTGQSTKNRFDNFNFVQR